MKITCFRNRDHNTGVSIIISRSFRRNRKKAPGKFSLTLKALVFLAIIIFSSTFLQAAIKTSIATGGTWATGVTWIGGVAPLATDSVVIATTGSNSVSLGAAATCAGLTIKSGSILNVGAFAITVNGTTSITGNLNITSVTGIKTFVGLVTINAGGTWNNSGNSAINLQGGLTNNGTFTAGTGIYTLGGTAGTIGGIIAVTIRNLTISGTATNNGILSVTTLINSGSFTNNGTLTAGTFTINGTGTATNNTTLTVSATLGGAGTFTNNATGVLNISGTATITTLTATAAGNQVNYTRAGSQTAKTTSYYNLTLSGSGIKTFTPSPTVINLLSVEGSATAAVTSGTFLYGTNATLQYTKNTGNRTISAEWISPYTATGGVIIKSPYTYTLNSAKVFTNSPLIVKAGATLALAAFPLSLNTGLVLECGTIATTGSRITGTSGALTPGGNITVTSVGTGVNGASISARVTLDATHTFTVANDGTAANDLTLSGIISGGFGITKAGQGTLLISGASSYTGLTTISAGILKLGSGGTAPNTPLGITAAGTVVAAGAVLDLAGYNLATAENITLNGNGAGGGALTSSNANSITYTGAILLGSASSISIAGTLTVPGLITGSYGLTKAGAGTLSLSGANTFTGGVTLNTGTLNINNAQALGTVAGTFTINGGTINNTSAGTVTMLNYPIVLNANLTFSGSRALNLGAGTITLNADRVITAGASTLTFGGTISAGSLSLTKAGGGMLNLSNSSVILNGLSITAGTLVSTTGTLSLTGNFSNSGTFTHNNGTVVFSGSAAQAIGGAKATAFAKLTLNNSAGLLLSNTVNTMVIGVLTLTTGNITTNANTLILSSTGSVSRTSGHVAGNLMKNIARAANVSRTFEVGDASNYTPVTLLFASVSTAGNLTVRTTAGDHPSLGTSAINTTRSVNRYFTLTNSGIVTSAASYSATFAFVGGDVDGGANTGSFIVNRYAASIWTTPAPGVRTATTTQATVAAASAFGDFAIGSSKLTTTSTAVVSSSNPSCFGSPVTFTATVTSSGSPVASEGTVTFMHGSTTLGTSGTLDAGGNGAFTTSVLAFGANSITAVFNATGNFTSSTSSALSQVVNATQWTGGASGNWENGANWCGGVPNSATDVVVPLGTTVYITSAYTTPAVCKNLTINTGASVIINSGKALTVNGTLTNNATSGVIVKSDITGTGSLLDNGISGSGTATVERYITKYNAVGDGMFHFLSTPVTGQVIITSFGNPTANFTNDFYKLDESTYTWISLRGAGNILNLAFEPTFTRGRGYLVAYNANATRTFTGTLNTGTLTTGSGLPALTYTSALGSSAGWNLIGNPYPSAIDWDNVTAGQSVNLANAVYVYDNATQQYKVYVGGIGTLTNGIIPSMQGFLLKASGASPSLTLENQDRVHGGNVYYKSLQTDAENVISLKVEGNTFQDETFVRFVDGATPEFNDEWDAYKIMSDSKAPSIYSVTSNLNYVVNTLPLTHIQSAVPVAVSVVSPGTYTITANGIESFTSGTYIRLDDKKTGTSQVLNDNMVYSFSASPDDASDRFVLNFMNVTSVPESVADETFGISQINGSLRITTGEATKAEIFVFNMLGQMVLCGNMNGNTLSTLNIADLQNGVYVLSLIKANKKTSKKIIVNN